MEGKDGDDDPRASPLDFPSASRIGAVFHHEQHQHPLQHRQQQYLWARPLSRNDDAFSSRQRVENTISPPTIPRETDFFAEGPQRTSRTPRQQEAACPPPPTPRQQINVSVVSNSAAVGSGTGEDRTIMMPRRSPSINFNFGSSIVPENTQEFSTTTSAFTSRSSQEDVLYHTGRIPAYAGRTIPAAADTVSHQQWYPSGTLPATGDISPFSSSTTSTSPRIQQEYHRRSRRPISILAPIHTGTTSLSSPSSYPLQELSYFAPVSSPQDDQDRSPGTRRGTSQTWSQSPSSLRPSSAHTITTMGSIDESVSSPIDLESTRGRAFLQPTARRSRESSRASSSSGRGRSSSVSSPTARRSRESSRASSSSGRGRSSSRRSRRGQATAAPSPTASAPNTADEDGTITPPPQNLRGDPFRSAKVKTEICRNFNTPIGCPFGDKCNYAHGDIELKFTKLMDLERAGLVDIEIFRIHPCPTWIATGACPFDQRCVGLHDPRVEGSPSNQAWLPHAETMINKVANGVNVDNFYHERVASVYNHCPVYGFVPIVDENASENEFKSEASFKNFYEFICNVDRMKKHEIGTPDQYTIDEERVLEIVLKLRQGKTGIAYSYMPTHMLYGELCMVLQTKKFQSRKVDGVMTLIIEEDEVTPSLDHDSSTFQVYEIAFGPVGDPTVRPVSIWFDVMEEDLVGCTPQQAKHHKRSRHRLKKKIPRSARSSRSATADDQSRSTEPFDHYQPRDRDAFNLVTGILRLRLKTIKVIRSNFDYHSKRRAIQYLEDEMDALKHSYFCQLKYWVTWSWPEQIFQDTIDDDTDVPPVDSQYDCYVHDVNIARGETCDDCHALGAKRYACNLTGVEKYVPSLIWKSFIINVKMMNGEPLSEIFRTSRGKDDDKFFSLGRLSIFQQLSTGRQVFSSRRDILPHISNTASQHDIETLFNQWDGTRRHYQANADITLKPMSKTELLMQQQSLKSLDALAKILTRALSFD